MDRIAASDLLGNIGKASLVWFSALIPAVAAGGSGWPLITTLMGPVAYLAAAYNVPIRETMAPSEKRKVAPTDNRPVD